MAEILFVMDRVPYPARQDGTTVRMFPIFESLSRRHEIDLLVISESVDPARAEAFTPFCREMLHLNPRGWKFAGAFRRLRQLIGWVSPTAPPRYHLVERRERAIADLRRSLSGRRYDTVAFVGPMAVLDVVREWPRWVQADRAIIDFIDSPTLQLSRSREGGLLEWLDLKRMLGWEARVGRSVDHLIYISRVDASEARHSTPVSVITNGVYTEADLAKVQPAGRWNVGFLGNLAFGPNQRAVELLLEDVLPNLAARHPDFRAVLIGRNPGPEVLERAEQTTWLDVTGAVDSIWPWLKGLDVAVYPMVSGSGVKNKVLETMLAAIPVVTSPLGNEGIYATPGEHLMVCESAGEIMEVTLQLLQDPEARGALAERGREFVAREFGWAPSLESYERVLLEAD